LLTHSQDKAADHLGGHAIIRAVAGSGKTTTLIEMIKRLIAKGAMPSDITFVVFNKDARKDIQKKLLETGINKMDLPKVYTFHSLALKLYKFLHKKGFTRLDRLETNDVFINKFSLRVLNSVKSNVEKKPAFASKEEAEAFINFIDIAKSTMLDINNAFDEWVGEDRYKYFIEAFERFENERKNSRFITFSDLIKDVVSICKSNKFAANILKGHVKHLLMDEVQDVNEVSVELAKVISDSSTNWVVVGDVDQCIYSWRGAEPEFLAYKLKNELIKNGSVKEYELPETFRYGHLVSLLSNNIISNNKSRTEGLCISSKHAPNSSLTIDKYSESGRFGKKVTDTIKNIQEKGGRLIDIAILVRLYSFSTEIELSLLKNNIPYSLEGGTTVFEKREVNALIGILEMSQGILFTQEDDIICHKINNILSLCFCGIKIEVTKRDIGKFKDDRGGLSKFILSFDTPHHTKFKRNKLQTLAASVRVLDNAKPSNTKPEDILTTFIKYNEISKLVDLFSVRQEDADNKMYTLNSFIDFIKNLKVDAKLALKRIYELSNKDNTNLDRLTISSIHKAKGLEWDYVIIPGLEDGLFPYTKKEKNVDIEAERRLFYVASTRCILHLYYLCPYDRELLRQMDGASGAHIPHDPIASRFVFESKPYISNLISKNSISKCNPEYTSSEIGKRYIDKYIKLSRESDPNYQEAKEGFQSMQGEK
jgi:DNA helicase-2/ATP-dependent DNA helicase PcrA